MYVHKRKCKNPNQENLVDTYITIIHNYYNYCITYTYIWYIIVLCVYENMYTISYNYDIFLLSPTHKYNFHFNVILVNIVYFYEF